MKNTIKLFAFIAFAAAIIFSLTAATCGSKSSGGSAIGGSGPLVGHWFKSQEDAERSITAAQNKMPDAWKGTIAESMMRDVEAYWVAPNEDIIFPSYSFLSDGKLLVGGRHLSSYTATASAVTADIWGRKDNDWADYTISGNELTLKMRPNPLNAGFVSGTYYRAR